MRYAIPCGCVLVKRCAMKQEYLGSLIEIMKKNRKIPKNAEKNFKVAFSACSLIAIDKGKKKIDKEVIYEYYRKKHDEVIDKRYEEMGDFDPQQCRVRAGTVIETSKEHATVKNSTGKKKYRTDYVPGLRKNDLVITHWDFVVEKIDSKTAEEMIELKDSMNIK